MKQRYVVMCVVIAAVLVAGLAIAGMMTGTVSSLDKKTGALTVNVDGKQVQFESDAGVVPKNVRINDKVNVTYEERDGKKKATKVWKVNIGC